MQNRHLDEIVEKTKSKSKLFARGGVTKTGIKPPHEAEVLDLSQLSGIKEYKPSEYTFTALAGTRLKEINQMLSKNGQFLPFDPPLAEKGATIGGTVATNLSGPMRYQYGGVRDFILGVHFIDHQGQLVQTGGKVVKNAAGFDIPKLMVGSLGSLGALVELSFKVFPRPQAYVTLIAQYEDFAEALQCVIDLTSNSAELLSLELQPHANSCNVLVRLGGNPDLFDSRLTNFKETLREFTVVQGDEETQLWRDYLEFKWVPEGDSLVKVPLIPKYIAALEEFLQAEQVIRWYSAGGNIAWIVWPQDVSLLDQKLQDLNLPGLTILGPAEQVRLGAVEQNYFYQKIKAALDPSGLWAEV